MKRRSILFIPLLLAGCLNAGIGPTDDPNFNAHLAAALPAGQTAQLSGTGTWHPNMRGFSGLRSAMLARPADPIPGVLVVTETSLIFLQWDTPENRFLPMKRLRFSDIEEVTLDRFGAARSVVIRNADFEHNSFAFTRAGGNIGDIEKTEELFALLRKRRPTN
jgi:hypothetical protein